MSTHPSPSPTGITRREAVKRTLLFSAALMTPSWLRALDAQPAATSAEGIHFLAVGDFGTGTATQSTVARQMAAYARGLNAPLSSVLALGDNFYGYLAPQRFDIHFEQMFPKDGLDVPFYAIAGNHDYGPHYDSQQGPAKVQIQLDYAAQNPSSRWKMPAKWYSVELPDPSNPLVRVIMLDSSYFLGALTPQEKLDQQRFLDAELAKKTAAPWTWMVTHYPMFNNGRNHEVPAIIKRWGPTLVEHQIPFYLCGHDHDLQHIQVEGYPTSFIVSGGGGGSLYQKKGTRPGFYASVFGFNHIHATKDWTDVRFVDTKGRILYAFRRMLSGEIQPLES